MSDFKLPDLPSDDELGIDGEDLEEFLEDEGSELSAAEMQALLGESPKPKAHPPTDAPSPSASEPAKKAKGRREEKKKAKEPKPKREPVPEGRPSRWRGVATLALLVFGAWLGSSVRTVPVPAPANAPDTAFSSARAMSHVVAIARAAHPTGSPEHDRVRAYIMDALRDLGLEPEVQTTTAMMSRGSGLRTATVRNIVARLPGADNTGAVLVTAHYDGAGIAHAAADDGAGVVSILESLRALRAGETLRNDIIVLITDAEELGLLGAQAFVDEHPWMDDVRTVISIEMRGAGGASVMFETGAEYGWILDAYRAGAPAPFANSLVYEVYKSMPNDTDFTRFREAGKQGLNFAAVGRAHIYHQVYDSPENLHEGTLQHHGLNTLSMLRTLGDEDLSVVNAPDVVYFSVPVLGLVVYPSGWVWPLTILVVLLWAVMGFVARWRGLNGWGIFAGLAVSATSVAALYGSGLWLSGWLARFHLEQGAIIGSAFHVEGWYVVALAALAVALVTALSGLARLKFAVPDLATGAGLVLVPLVVGVTYLVPLGAMNLQWPVLAFLAASAAAQLPGAGGLREVRWIFTAAAAFVVVLMLTPIVELLWLTMSIRLASAIGALIVVMLLLALPALDALREPNAWWAPTTALVLAAAFLGVGILQARPSPERPLPSTLIYALDNGTGEALWATQPSTGAQDPARTWAEAGTGGGFSENTTLGAFQTSPALYAVSDAPAVNTPPVAVSLDFDSIVGDARTVRVAVRSTLSAEMLLFRLPEGGAILVAVNGKTIPALQPGAGAATGSLTDIEHWGRPDGSVLLDLVIPVADTAVAFEILEHSLRPSELLGAGVFERPATLAANVALDSDRAMIRTPVFLPLATVSGASRPAAGPSVSETVPSDTLGLETPVPDTLAPDTTSADTLPRPDTTAADTLPPPDTIGR